MGLQGARASPTTGAKLLTLSSSCQTFSFTRQVAQNSGGKKKKEWPSRPLPLFFNRRIYLVSGCHHLSPPSHRLTFPAHSTALNSRKKKNQKKQKTRYAASLGREGLLSSRVGSSGQEGRILAGLWSWFLKKKKHTTATRSVGIKRSCCLSSREPVESSAPLPSYR